jgi:hypothetical protein
MKRLTRRILFTGGATALAVGVSAGVALAVAITFSITPGGNISASAGTTTLKDVTNPSHATLTCASSNSTGTLKSGHGISGANLGSITALSFKTCTGPLGLTFTVTNSAFPWKLTGTSFKSGVTTGTITGIKSHLSGPSCSADVAGATASAKGKVKVTYTNSTHKLKVLPTGGNLHIFNVSGCAGLLSSGDATQFSGTYTVTPAQTITSP